MKNLHNVEFSYIPQTSGEHSFRIFWRDSELSGEDVQRGEVVALQEEGDHVWGVGVVKSALASDVQLGSAGISAVLQQLAGSVHRAGPGCCHQGRDEVGVEAVHIGSTIKQQFARRAGGGVGGGQMEKTSSFAVFPLEKRGESLVGQPRLQKTEKHFETRHVVLHGQVDRIPLERGLPVHFGLHARDHADARSLLAGHREHPLGLLLLPLRRQDPLLVESDKLGGDHLGEQGRVQVGEQEPEHGRFPLQDGQVHLFKKIRNVAEKKFTRLIRIFPEKSIVRPLRVNSVLIRKDISQEKDICEDFYWR